MKWGVDVDAGISSNNARRPNRDRGAKKKPAARVLRRPSCGLGGGPSPPPILPRPGLDFL